MKKIFFTIILLILLPVSVFAFEAKSGNFVNVSKEEVVEGSFFVQGDVIAIDGIVNGDVFCLAQKIEITGTVNGDIICAGGKINFSGTSTGDVRLVGDEIIINGRVGKNLNVVANYFNLEGASLVNNELFVLANISRLNGEIKSDIYGAVKEVEISALVGGDLSLRQGNGFFASEKQAESKLLNGATIEGDFIFKSKQDILKENGVIIKGEEKIEITKQKKEKSADNIFWTIVIIFSNILISLALISIFKNFVNGVIANIKDNSRKSIWMGVLAFFLLPLTSILLLLTLIGAPLAIILLFVFIGLILINKSLLAILIGQKLLEAINNRKKESLTFSAIIGAPVVYVLSSLPFFGAFFSSVGLIIVLGAIVYQFRATTIK